MPYFNYEEMKHFRQLALSENIFEGYPDFSEYPYADPSWVKSILDKACEEKNYDFILWFIQYEFLDEEGEMDGEIASVDSLWMIFMIQDKEILLRILDNFLESDHIGNAAEFTPWLKENLSLEKKDENKMLQQNHKAIMKDLDAEAVGGSSENSYYFLLFPIFFGDMQLYSLIYKNVFEKEFTKLFKKKGYQFHGRNINDALNTVLFDQKEFLQRDFFEYSHLRFAVLLGNCDFVKYLFENYPWLRKIEKLMLDQSFMNSNIFRVMDDLKLMFGRTLISIAAQFGYLDIVQYLAGKQPETINKKFNYRDSEWTPLFLAAAHGHIEVMNYFLYEKAVPLTFNALFQFAILEDQNATGSASYLRDCLELLRLLKMPTDQSEEIKNVLCRIKKIPPRLIDENGTPSLS